VKLSSELTVKLARRSFKQLKAAQSAYQEWGNTEIANMID